MTEKRTRWLSMWNPTIEGTEHNRLEYILLLRGAIETFSRRTNVWIDQDLLHKILRHGVLNASQLSNLLEISREMIYGFARRRGDLPEPVAPRGKIDRYDLDLMYLLVQQLALGQKPKDFLLEALPYCGDTTIVAFLTGVPRSTIYRYRRRRELQDGINYRQRIIDDPELLARLGGQVRSGVS